MDLPTDTPIKISIKGIMIYGRSSKPADITTLHIYIDLSTLIHLIHTIRYRKRRI